MCLLYPRQELDGLCLTDYEADATDINNVIGITVSSVLGGSVSPSEITFVAATRKRRNRSRLLQGRSGGSSSSMSKKKHTDSSVTATEGEEETPARPVKVESSEDDGSCSVTVSYSIYYTTTAQTYDSLSSQLVAAVSDGSFTSTLQQTATANSVSILADVTTSVISTVDYAVTAAPSEESVTSAPTPTLYTSPPTVTGTSAPTPTLYTSPPTVLVTSAPTPTLYTSPPTVLLTSAPSQTSAPTPTSYTSPPTSVFSLSPTAGSTLVPTPTLFTSFPTSGMTSSPTQTSFSVDQVCFTSPLVSR